MGSPPCISMPWLKVDPRHWGTRVLSKRERLTHCSRFREAARTAQEIRAANTRPATTTNQRRKNGKRLRRGWLASGPRLLLSSVGPFLGGPPLLPESESSLFLNTHLIDTDSLGLSK